MPIVNNYGLWKNDIVSIQWKSGEMEYRLPRVHDQHMRMLTLSYMYNIITGARRTSDSGIVNFAVNLLCLMDDDSRTRTVNTIVKELGRNDITLEQSYIKTLLTAAPPSNRFTVNQNSAFRFKDNILGAAPARGKADPEREASDKAAAELFRELLVVRFTAYAKKFARQYKLTERENKLSVRYDLSDIETRIILFVYYFFWMDYASFNGIISTVDHEALAELVSLATKLPFDKVSELLDDRSPLMRKNIFNITYDRQNGNCTIKFYDEVIRFFMGKIDDIFEDSLLRVSGTVYPIDSFEIKPDEVNTVRKLLSMDMPVNMLFYGFPGTGKTEFARSICVDSGRTAYVVKPSTLSTGTNTDNSFRIAQLGNALNNAKKGDVIIVDDADLILNSNSPTMTGQVFSTHKNIVNEFMEKHGFHMIWIANTIAGTDTAHLRRFTFSISFVHFSVRQRQAMWRSVLKESAAPGMLTEQEIVQLAEQYAITTGGISLALNRCAEAVKTGALDRDGAFALMRSILDSHAKITQSKVIDKRSNINKIVTQYDPELITMNVNQNTFITSAEAAYTRIYGENSMPIAYNILFAGQPGTGKTEYAKYLANRLGVELLVKRGSDLLNKFVGGTEARIAEAFRDVSDRKSILMIDECEGLIGRREIATQSWQLTQTNEFLTQMENFNGILICCTNHVNMIDAAAIRRFHWKIEFTPPKPEARMRLYLRYFESAGPFDTSAESRLRRMDNLTPGDVRAVWQRSMFNPEGTLSHQSILEELEREITYRIGVREKIVGF